MAPAPPLTITTGTAKPLTAQLRPCTACAHGAPLIGLHRSSQRALAPGCTPGSPRPTAGAIASPHPPPSAANAPARCGAHNRPTINLGASGTPASNLTTPVEAIGTARWQPDGVLAALLTPGSALKMRTTEGLDRAGRSKLPKQSPDPGTARQHKLSEGAEDPLPAKKAGPPGQVDPPVSPTTDARALRRRTVGPTKGIARQRHKRNVGGEGLGRHTRGALVGPHTAGAADTRKGPCEPGPGSSPATTPLASSSKDLAIRRSRSSAGTGTGPP